MHIGHVRIFRHSFNINSFLTGRATKGHAGRLEGQEVRGRTFQVQAEEP